MVTLIGFCFILTNVAFLVIFMPDLVGPVRFTLPKSIQVSLALILRDPLGPVVVVLQLCLWSLDVFNYG
jgi:hypothetical protein